MRVVIGWIVAGTLLAFTVLLAASAPYARDASWLVTVTVGVSAGLGSFLRPGESKRQRDRIGALLATLRPMLSLATGAVTFLSVFVAECDHEAGVPSWERCNSFLGTPAVDWPGASLSALALGIGVGYLVWWLFGTVFPNRVD
ncbi:MAG: hypothetical protein OXC98_10720 [bacterium]|nr:hypothetical protein [Acidimicrobiia bacterium]MCY4650822.1 hypothetical protein [bacterium]